MTGSRVRRLLGAVLLILFSWDRPGFSQAVVTRPAAEVSAAAELPKPRSGDPRLFSSGALLDALELPAAFRVKSLTRVAGLIFSGRVMSVGRTEPSLGAATESTVIRFHVDEGLLGVATGQTLTIHEWAGLWKHGERYRVGERVWLFLFPPSRLGLTSPVGGTLGRFKVDPRGRVHVRQKMSGHSTAPAPGAEADPMPREDFARMVRFALAKEVAQ